MNSENEAERVRQEDYLPYFFLHSGILVMVVYSTKKDSQLVVIFFYFFIQILFSCCLAFDPDFSLITQIYILSLFQIDLL